MACWALGSILGPCLGALVAEPCTTWEIFRSSQLCTDPTTLLRRFPFLIPFCGSAALSAISCIIAVLALYPEASVRAVWPAEPAEDEHGASGTGGEAQDPDTVALQDNDAVRHTVAEQCNTLLML